VTTKGTVLPVWTPTLPLKSKYALSPLKVPGMPFRVAEAGNLPPVLNTPTLAYHEFPYSLLGLKKHWAEPEAMGRVFVKAIVHLVMPGAIPPVATSQDFLIRS